MFFIYIIHSEKADKFYVGYSKDPHRRLIEHNTKPFNTYTSKYRPWILKAIFQCSMEEKEAIAMERFIKKQKSKKFLQQLIDAEILDGILAQLVRVPKLRD